MTAAIEWCIPPSVRHWLGRVPIDLPVALLLRHSVRGFLPPLDAGYQVPITGAGRALGRALGLELRGRLRTLHASPLLRCVQTAEVLREGASASVSIVPDRLLGDPGVYVVDDRRALANWESLGHEGVMAHLVAAQDALPGMAVPEAAARFLVQHMLTVAGGEPGVHVFVTHDSLVTATAARLLGRPLGSDAWPWYLEGAFFWRADSILHAAYREHHREGCPEPLCGLSEVDVVELARREVATTVGLDSGARFFLAGGAFKTLLTGRPPRDLDLWAASAADRAALSATLELRGAKRLEPPPFADAFEVADRIVEVPHKVEPSTLEGRLGRCDIALAAVGVEHRPGDIWRACINQLALESVERRQVLLLKPLVNWKHALTTLERMRRYAEELGFAIPAEEEEAVWRVYGAEPPEVRAGMLERLARTGRGTYHVAEDAACRFP